MGWKFWENASEKGIPDSVRKELQIQFHLTQEHMSGLRYAEQSGKFANTSVKFISIFDPSLFEGGESAKDFDKIPEHSVKYRGRVYQDGNIWLQAGKPA